MAIKRILILAPLALVALLLQSFFWVPTYEEQTRGDSERLEKFIQASIGDARFLNPVLSADGSSSQINQLVYDALLEFDEDLAFAPSLAESFEVGETAFVSVDGGARFPDGRRVDGAELTRRIDAALAGLARSVTLVPAETRTESHTVVVPGEGDAPPAPQQVEAVLRVPDRVAIELPRVVPELFRRLEPVLGPGYPPTLRAAERIGVPEGPAGEALLARADEVLPLLEHNPTLTFTLRPGVRFHDGHELDADDVRFTYEAFVDPRNLSPRGSDFEPIRRVEVLGPRRVRVVYKRLFSPAVYTWASYGILPEHLLDEEALTREMDAKGIGAEARASYGLREADFTRAPVGTGPFRFERWDSDHLIHLVRNDDYWKAPALFREYFYRVVPDLLTQEIEFRSGAIDAYGAQPHQAARYREDPRYQAFSSVSFGYTYIGYNTRNPMLQDPRVRRALGMAIDVEEIIRFVLYGEGERTTGPWAIQTEWYDHGVEPLPYDPEGALALLAEVGWRRNAAGRLERDGVPFAFTLITNNGNPQRKAIAAIAQNAWRRIGIDVSVQLFEWAVFLKDFINVGEFDATVLGWSTGIDHDQFQIWHSSQAGPQQLNFVGYDVPDVDRLLETLRVEYDRPRQIELAHELHRRIAEDQPYTFLYAPRSTLVLDRKIVMVEAEGDEERVVPLRPTPTGDLTYYFRQWKKLDHVPEF